MDEIPTELRGRSVRRKHSDDLGIFDLRLASFGLRLLVLFFSGAFKIGLDAAAVVIAESDVFGFEENHQSFDPVIADTVGNVFVALNADHKSSVSKSGHVFEP